MRQDERQWTNISISWGSRSGFRCQIGLRARAHPAARWKDGIAGSSRSTRHGTPPDLHAAYLVDKEGRNWTYLPHGPYARFEDYLGYLERAAASDDPLIHCVIERSNGRAAGVASYMRIDAAAGVIEVGGINYSPLLQRTPAATEAMYLMMRRVFDELGYRRYEWKCDALNAPSRAAALRLGFQYEGMFRQATVYKGRNRDTCWFSILDREWPALKEAFERWLDPGNFDAAGRQHQSLSGLHSG